MKKLISLLLALMLTAMLPMSAMAGATLNSSTAMERSVTLCNASNTYIVHIDGAYYLCDATGSKLSDGYADMGTALSGTFVYTGIGGDLNDEGLLDAKTGSTVIPNAYGDTYVVNADWTMGIHLVPTTETESDYKTWDGTEHYNIDYVDVYYQAAKVATLTREEYRAGYFSAYGPYIVTRLETTKALWIDAQGKRTEVTGDYVSTSEYEYQYPKGVMHNATQQYAFTSTCTLTADQVVRTVWYNDDGDFIDLQGNVIGRGPSIYHEYDTVGYYGGDFMYIRANSKYGIVDMQGNEVLPAVYADMGGGTETTTYYAVGYQAVLDGDGKLSYLDKSGNVVSSVDFSLSSGDYKGFYYNAPIIAVKNMNSYMIITATKGLLTETYEDAYTVSSAYQRIISVQKDGLWGCIDMNGNTVVPFIHRYSLDISNDGTLVTGHVKDGDYMLYTISYVDDAPAAPALVEGE